jgi:DNA primase
MSGLSKFYEEIKLKCKVSEMVSKTTSLSKKGSEYLGLCPFHTEKTPSFTINDFKGFYHCFGCGVHGDVIKFYSERYKISYHDSAVRIAQEVGIEIKKLSKQEEQHYKELDNLHSITEISCNFYKSSVNKEISDYLAKRSIPNELIEKFEIGYAPPNNVLYRFLESKNQSLAMMNKAGVVGKDEQNNIYDIFRNRIIFPIRNVYNKVVGFGGRVLGDSLPKYINSPDNVLFQKKNTLYGENIVSSYCYKTNNIIVVEGYFDVISMHKVGLCQTLASLGTAVTKDHLIKIFKMVDEIIICMDGDKAGLNSIKKVIDNVIDLVSTNKIISFVLIPDSLDPDNFITRDGKDAMYSLIEKRVSLSEMILRIQFDNIEDKKPETKAKLEKTLDIFTSKITDSYIKKNFNEYFKRQIWKSFNISEKTSNINKMNIVIPELVTNIGIIEKTMLYCIVNNPFLLLKQTILDFLIDVSLEDEHLESLKNWIMNEVNFDSVKTTNELIELIKNSSFKGILENLSKDNLIIPNFHGDEAKLIDFWEVLYMKHNLIKIKQEYFNIMSSPESLDSEALKGYESEISRLVTKIDVVTNKILMN